MKNLVPLCLSLFLVTGGAFARSGGHGHSSSSHHSNSSSTTSKSSTTCCAISSSDEHVGGYTKKDGTHVDGYMKTAPNSTEKDNFSTKGNTNPYTGKEGTKESKK